MNESMHTWRARCPNSPVRRPHSSLKPVRSMLNGKIPRKSEKTAPGDQIDLELPAAQPSLLEPEDIPLRIVHEDADLVVIDKPAGLVVHPAPGHARGTLVHALLHHVKDLSGIGGVRRPGIVHRLDKDTSGLMLVAKHDQSHRALSAALKRRAVKRIYLAASWGHLERDMITVEAPIARAPRQRLRMAIVAARAACHHAPAPPRTLARRRPAARRAGDRAHPPGPRAPAIDRAPGGGRSDRTVPQAARGMSGPIQGWSREFARRVPRQFLHATELAFEHPTTGTLMRFESPLPEELSGPAEWARQTS